jgi:U-box domain
LPPAFHPSTASTRPLPTQDACRDCECHGCTQLSRRGPSCIQLSAQCQEAERKLANTSASTLHSTWRSNEQLTTAIMFPPALDLPSTLQRPETEPGAVSVPAAFRCPLGSGVMTAPVVTPAGMTYDRCALCSAACRHPAWRLQHRVPAYITANLQHTWLHAHCRLLPVKCRSGSYAPALHLTLCSFVLRSHRGDPQSDGQGPGDRPATGGQRAVSEPRAARSNTGVGSDTRRRPRPRPGAARDR